MVVRNAAVSCNASWTCSRHNWFSAFAWYGGFPRDHVGRNYCTRSLNNLPLATSDPPYMWFCARHPHLCRTNHQWAHHIFIHAAPAPDWSSRMWCWYALFHLNIDVPPEVLLGPHRRRGHQSATSCNATAPLPLRAIGWCPEACREGYGGDRPGNRGCRRHVVRGTQPKTAGPQTDFRQ